MAQKPLDGESNATVCHDREKVTSVSVNNIPKTKLVLQAAGDQGDRTCCWGGTYPHSASEFWFRYLICRNGSVTVGALVQSPPQSVASTHSIGISTTSINFATFYHQVIHLSLSGTQACQ